MSKRTTNPDFLNGVPELVVLELLSRRPMYGYELVQTIKEKGHGVLEFGEGCIYPLLHKLSERGDVTSRRVDIGGRSRVVYRITTRGNERRVETFAQWSAVVATIGGILQGGKHEEQRARIA